MIGYFGELPSVVQVSFSWLDRIILVVIGALFGALFAFVSNTVHWRQKTKTETIQSLAKEFFHLLDILDGSVKELWSASCSDLGKSREITLSSSIKTTLLHIEKCLELVFKLKKIEHHKQRENFQTMIENIGHYATSGSFEEENRNSSPEKIMQSSNAILDLRVEFQEFIYQ